LVSPAQATACLTHAAASGDLRTVKASLDRGVAIDAKEQMDRSMPE